MGDLTADRGWETSAVNAVYLALGEGSDSGEGSGLMEIFPTSYNIKNSCKLLGSPSEGGLTQYDNKVIQPSEVSFTGIIKSDYFRTVQEIRDNIDKMDLGSLKCQFMGKAGDIKNMIIETFEEIGTPNRYDAVEVKVTLREFLEHNREPDEGSGG